MMEPNALEMRLSRGELDATLKTLYGAGGMQAARERCAQVLERFRQTFDCPPRRCSAHRAARSWAATTRTISTGGCWPRRWTWTSWLLRHPTRAA